MSKRNALFVDSSAVEASGSALSVWIRMRKINEVDQPPIQLRAAHAGLCKLSILNGNSGFPS
jgi:hypothetical protein